MSKKKLIIGGVVVLVVLAAIASGGSENTPAGTVSTPSPGASAVAQSPVAAVSDAPTEVTPSASPAAAYKIGDRIKLGDEEYFAVVEVDPAFKGDGIFKPDADELWVAALVEIEGINPSGASYNPFFFKVRDEQGFEYSFAAFGKEPALKSGNDLKPGQKVKGWITFEVPKTVKALTLTYTPGFLGEPVEVVLK